MFDFAMNFFSKMPTICPTFVHCIVNCLFLYLRHSLVNMGFTRLGFLNQLVFKSKEMAEMRVCLRAALLLLILFSALVPSFAQYTLGGNASNLGSGCYRLTPASNSQAGYVYKQAAINLNDTFYQKYSVYLGTSNSGGHGMVFVMRGALASPFIGGGGSAMGYLGNPFSTNSLGIEIDTHQDQLTYNDPTNDHMALHKNGNVDHAGANNLVGPIQASVTSANIEDGEFHTLEVEWNPSTFTLKVWFDCSLRINYTSNIVNTIFSGDTLVHWGFVGATGGYSNEQKFCLTSPLESYVQDVGDEQICLGDTVALSAGQSLINYSWSPSVGLSSTSIHNPFANPTVTTTYVIEKSYQCDTIMDTTTVTVVPPNFNIIEVITNASCKDVCNGAVDLTITNGTGAYTFIWSNASTNEDLSGLCDGTYYVTVQDTSLSSPNYLCYRSDTVVITEPNLLVPDIINATKTKCPGSNACNATANAVAVGGTLPYSFNWSNSEIVHYAQALCPGWNFVTITDAQFCQVYDSVFIQIPDAIVTDAFKDTMVCISKVAALSAYSIGGTPPYSYVWHRGSLTGPVISINGSDIVQPTQTTTYFVESFDANGCSGDTAKVKVKVRPPLSIDFVSPDTICPYDTVSIDVSGNGGDSLYTFTWSTGAFGPSVTVSPDLTTYFVVTVSDFCGTPFHVDSVRMQVGGYSGITSSIRVEDDSLCLGESIYMIASGKGGFRGPEEYVFTWLHNGSNGNVQFVTPSQTTNYVVKIEDLCLSTPGFDTVRISVGEPEFPDVKFSPEVACRNSDLEISIDELKSSYTYNWQIDTIDAFLDYEYDSLIYNFNKPGCYFFDLLVTTEFGCTEQHRFDCAINVLEGPRASFTHTPENPTSVEPMLTFRNASESESTVFWVINSDTVYNSNILVREFYESDEPYQVKLFAQAENGCVDSLIKEVSYMEETIIIYPNSFTPNGDLDNDIFYIQAEGIQVDGVELMIIDRWGSQVYFSKRLDQGWDGKKPAGSLVPMGTYFFTLRYRDRFNIERLISDKINVVLVGTEN